MNANAYNALRYMTRDYYVKWQDENCRRGLLIGVYGLVNRVGEELAVRLYTRALRAKSDKITCKLRRGAIVTFYVK